MRAVARSFAHRSSNTMRRAIPSDSHSPSQQDWSFLALSLKLSAVIAGSAYVYVSFITLEAKLLKAEKRQEAFQQEMREFRKETREGMWEQSREMRQAIAALRPRWVWFFLCTSMSHDSDSDQTVCA